MIFELRKGKGFEGEGFRNKRFKGQASWVDGVMGQRPIEILWAFQISTGANDPIALNVGPPLLMPKLVLQPSQGGVEKRRGCTCCVAYLYVPL